MKNDFSVIDVPSDLCRSVKRKDVHGQWVRDDAWYRDILKIYGALLRFFSENGLIRDTALMGASAPPLEELVLRYSDLTDLGQKLVKTGRIDRWLASFDQPGSKKPLGDVEYLERELRKIS